MRTIIKSITVMTLLISLFIGAAHARTYYYFDTIPGFINTACVGDEGPFCGTPAAQQGNVSLIINDGDDFMMETSETDATVTITLTMSNDADEDSTVLTAVSDDDSVIDDLNISFDTQTGLTRVMTIASAEALGTTNITISAKIGSILEGTGTLASTVTSDCDTDNDTIILETDEGWEQDGSNNWLIGGLAGDSTTAKNQLLCLSQNQTAAVLSADYLMTANVTFDIDFDVSKTYQDNDGVACGSKSVSCPFLDTMTATVNSNNEDWDGDGVVDDTSTTGWIPLGNSSNYFTGDFDGDGHTISDIYISLDQGESTIDVGFFGYLSGSTIENLTIDNSWIKESSQSFRAGGLFGISRSATVRDCHATESVNVYGWVAGNLAGYVGDGETFAYIEQCSAKGDVMGSVYAGGLIGSIRRGWIKESFATGDVTSTRTDALSLAGGLLAHLDNIPIYDSYATGNVTKEYSGSGIGGLVGRGFCSHSGIYDSYASGKVSTMGDASLNGGILGTITGSKCGNTIIEDSYALNDDMRASGQHGISSLTDYCSSTFNAECVPQNIRTAGWSDAIWGDLSSDTPQLEWE